MQFDTFKNDFSIPRKEEEILQFWEENMIFEKSKEQAKDLPHFIFYEGPPTANGRPGIHHVLARTFKDLFCRYKTMQGFRVDRKGGWDTHGLAVEIEVEKQLKLDSKAKIVAYGIEKFNKECKKSVFKYLDDWNKITRRIGYWLDLDDPYITLTNEYIESVWWILKNFYDRDLIYQGHKILPFCPRCETGLSSHEVAQGYATVKDPSIFVKFLSAEGDFSYLVWTTTPWTLPSNAALCIKADADYVMVDHEGEKLVLAEALVERVFGYLPKVVDRKKGNEYLKQRYVPLFDFYSDMSDQAFYVIDGDFVTLDDGTGIVHVAPGFGADDYAVGQKFGLPILQAINPDGLFKDLAGPYAGKFVKDADPMIIKDLKIAGRMFKKETYEHTYPFCWRCDSPLIYIARESWYIRTTQFRDRLIALNNEINWHPDEIRTGRMLNWLENNVDWAISRERFWGTPLPIWICDDKTCGKKEAVGSIEQLRKQAVNAPEKLDLHKPMMDEVKLKCECGGEMTRVSEVIDVWFDSGAMPFAQWHYPFENKEQFETKYPSDFISEGIDQTRGWFYSLLAISTLLFDKAPFKNVVVTEFVLDKKGKKMSKHKGNVVDPFATVDRFGADPVRWYLVTSSSPWSPTRFDSDGIAEVIRKYFDTLRNAYSFFALYANIDEVQQRAGKAGLSIEDYLAGKAGEPNRFDSWINSRYNSLIKDVTSGFDGFEITRPIRAMQSFVIDDLSNWYVRNNRRRFWAKEDDPSKMRAYLTLYRILEGICRMTAPVSPFTSEMIWQELMGTNQENASRPESVHLCRFPVADESAIDAGLEKAMGQVENIVSLGRAARSRKNIKIRQPLSEIVVGLPDGDAFDMLAEYHDIIADELNVRKVSRMSSVEDYVDYSAKLNFKTAGPKFGDNVKRVAARVSELTDVEIGKLKANGEIILEIDTGKLAVTVADVQVTHHDKDGYAFETGGSLSIAMATSLTPELIDEGFAREMVNKIQNMRKSMGFDVTDRIRVAIHSAEPLISATRRHDEFIRKETLANQIEFVEQGAPDGSQDWNINGIATAIAVEKDN